MSIDFVAIDFETANQKRASACSVGLTKVKNGKIVDSFYSLINPEDVFNPFNTYIHGISKEMVEAAPTYFDVIQDVKIFIDDLPLVAHYAPFDMGVIRESNDRYNVMDFDAYYFDSLYLTKQYIKSISYKLSYLSDTLGIKFKHHDALDDSRACAELILHLCKDNNFLDIQTLLDGARYSKMGRVTNSEGSKFRINKNTSKTNGIDIDSIINSVDKTTLDNNHPFFEKHACFTGKLESMTRQSAMTLLAQCGGVPEKSVNRKVNFLVLGEQDFRIVGDDLKSSKIIKAEKLLNDGQDIQLLSEDDFLRMI